MERFGSGRKTSQTPADASSSAQTAGSSNANASTSGLPLNVDYTNFTEYELEQLEKVFRKQQEFEKEMRHSFKYLTIVIFLINLFIYLKF